MGSKTITGNFKGFCCHERLSLRRSFRTRLNYTNRLFVTERMVYLKTSRLGLQNELISDEQHGSLQVYFYVSSEKMVNLGMMSVGEWSGCKETKSQSCAMEVVVNILQPLFP